MSTIHESRLSFGKREHEPEGIKMGPCAHAIVKLGVVKARQAINMLRKDSSEDYDPMKGWRNALQALVIDAAYRSAYPDIEKKLRELEFPKDQTVSQIIDTRLEPTTMLAQGILEAHIEQVFSQKENPWLTEVAEELIGKTYKREINAIQNLKANASTLFIMYLFLGRTLARKNPNVSIEEASGIIKQTYASIIAPDTRLHIDDSNALGGITNSYCLDVSLEPFGLRDDKLTVGNQITYTPSVYQEMKDHQINNPLPSIRNGCPALLSPRITQERYEGQSIPTYSNAISGIYSQLTEAIFV